jgi:hypothetical protein
MTTEEVQVVEEGFARLERRSRQRYPLKMPLSGRFAGKRGGSITGETVNLSSRGILFIADEVIPVHAQIELEIQWPVRSGTGKPLRLSVFATAVRSTRKLVAARIWSHDFITAPDAEATLQP